MTHSLSDPIIIVRVILWIHNTRTRCLHSHFDASIMLPMSNIGCFLFGKQQQQQQPQRKYRDKRPAHTINKYMWNVERASWHGVWEWDKSWRYKHAYGFYRFASTMIYFRPRHFAPERERATASSVGPLFMFSYYCLLRCILLFIRHTFFLSLLFSPIQFNIVTHQRVTAHLVLLSSGNRCVCVCIIMSMNVESLEQ